MTHKSHDKLKEIIEKIESLSVLELAELVKTLEEKFGVSPTYAAGVVGAPTASVGAATESVGEEKSVFNVELKSAGDKKIEVIKVLRDTLGLGLKDAKDLADAAPKIVKEGMDKKAAEELKTKLEEAGAVVELK